MKSQFDLRSTQNIYFALFGVFHFSDTSDLFKLTTIILLSNAFIRYQIYTLSVFKLGAFFPETDRDELSSNCSAGSPEIYAPSVFEFSKT